MCMKNFTSKRRRLMRKRARYGLILLVILALAWVIVPSKQPIRLELIVEKGKQTYADKKANRKLALDYAKAGYGWAGEQGRCLVRLWTLESRFDTHAVPRHPNGKPRSTAYGIAQLLNEKSNDPAIQILHGLRYIQYRYSNPCRAELFHKRHNFY